VDEAWAKRALCAPSVVQKDGWYYLFFGANDIRNDQQPGGIGVGRSPVVDRRAVSHPDARLGAIGCLKPAFADDVGPMRS